MHPSRRSFARAVCVLATALLLPVPALADGEEAPDREQLSETQTAYVGAQLLHAGDTVEVGEITTGIHGDVDGRERYLFWEGDSLFAGVIHEETGNRIDLVAEFYWFDSSVDRNADFYLVVLKATSTPTPDTNWHVATEESWVDNLMLRDIGPVQQVEGAVDRSGEHGAIRWDWSVPFQNYRWEPERVIEVEQKYAAGVNAEGGAMASVTEGVNIQAKGFVSADHQVKSRYTITLWRWQMLVLAGATDMSWNLVALDPSHAQDPAYHEYFLVLQAERDAPVHMNFLRFATTLREDIFLLPDHFLELSASIADVVLTAPPDPLICEAGYRAVNDECVRICPDGEEWQAGQCVERCAEGFEKVGDVCQKSCPDGFVPEGGKCVAQCEEGMRAEGDACIRDCPPGRVPDGNAPGGCRLSCPSGAHAEGEICVMNCPRGTFEQDGECVEIPERVECGEGTHRERDTCVPDAPGPGADPGADDECTLHSDCDLGKHCDGGRCVSRCLTDTDCGSGLDCNERGMCVQGQAPLGNPGPSVVLPAEDGGCATATNAGGWMDRLAQALRRR